MELFRIFIFITPENLVFAQYCACFFAQNCAIFIANCERQKAQSYAIKKLFFRIIALDFIAQNYAIFIANCHAQHAQWRKKKNFSRNLAQRIPKKNVVAWKP